MYVLWGIRSWRNVYSKLSHPKLECKAQSLSPQCGLCLLTGAGGAAPRRERRNSDTVSGLAENAWHATLISRNVAPGAPDRGSHPKGLLPCRRAPRRGDRRRDPAGKRRSGGSGGPVLPFPNPLDSARAQTALPLLLSAPPGPRLRCAAGGRGLGRSR